MLQMSLHPVACRLHPWQTTLIALVLSLLDVGLFHPPETALPLHL